MWLTISRWDVRLSQRSGSYSLRSGTFPSREVPVPEISRFLGIVITMYFNDHEPPHFHVRYARTPLTLARPTGQRPRSTESRAGRSSGYLKR